MKTYRHAVISPALPGEYLDVSTLSMLNSSNFKGTKIPDGRVVFRSADACQLDELCEHLAKLIEHKLQENRQDYPTSLAVNVAVIGEAGAVCGGEAYFVAAFHVEHFSTEAWLAEKGRAHENAGGVEFF